MLVSYHYIGTVYETEKRTTKRLITRTMQLQMNLAKLNLSILLTVAGYQILSAILYNEQCTTLSHHELLITAMIES